MKPRHVKSLFHSLSLCQLPPLCCVPVCVASPVGSGSVLGEDKLFDSLFLRTVGLSPNLLVDAADLHAQVLDEE